MAEIFSVSQINSYIKNLFAGNPVFRRIYVRGEISNCKYHSSGHIYFTLKDEGAQIACVMFAGHRAGISFHMEDGQSVIVFGSISVYERDGKYQLYAEEIRRDGVGRLYEEFTYLKEKLLSEGLFDAEHKKPVPQYVRTVGIVTAVTGAAVRDICQIAARRNPYVQLILYPAQVQGDGAAQSVVRGIRALDGRVDVIIVGRGGGSIEDLWAFNEEITARAIYECNTPVISAVGHETDTTIADYVADLRAPTPSAAAELAVYDIRLLEGQLAGMHSDMAELLYRKITSERAKVKQAGLLLKRYHPSYQLWQKKQRLADIRERICRQMDGQVEHRRQQVMLYAGRLKGVSPMERLSGGYSFVMNEAGEPVTKVRQVKEGQLLTVTVTDGTIMARTELIKEEKREQQKERFR